MQLGGGACLRLEVYQQHEETCGVCFVFNVFASPRPLVAEPSGALKSRSQRAARSLTCSSGTAVLSGNTGGVREIPFPKAETELHPAVDNRKLPLQSVWEIPVPSFAAPTRREVWLRGPRQLLGLLVGKGTVV